MPTTDTIDTDYLVIGAGSGGCAAAHVLATRSEARVVLLESGGTNDRLDVVRPASWPELLASDANWGYQTVPNPRTANRVHLLSMGKVLGGSSSVNGMMWMRGAPWDYDRWAEFGNPGWDSARVYETFRQLEDDPDGDGSVHGTGGPVKLVRVTGEHPLTAAFLAACQEIGLGPTKDFNGLDPEGFGPHQLNMFDGRRQDAGVAFLSPLRERPSLSVLTGATATRLDFDPSGERVRSVEVGLADGATLRVRVDREVILSAGAIASPQLLMLSGVGPSGELARLGIGVVRDLGGVGQNLHDHVGVPVAYEARKPVPNTRYQRVEAGVYLRSDPALDHYDMQIPMQQFPFLPPGFSGGEHGFTFFGGTLKPLSRGSVRLRSADPAAAPLVDPNYLAEPEDLDKLMFVLGVAREIGSSHAFDEWRLREAVPGPDTTSPADVERFVRAAAGTYFHPAGTCRMGSGPDAVVDNRLRVQGMANLRVADASVMPEIVSGNTNAPSMMIGWRCAEFALEDAAGDIGAR